MKFAALVFALVTSSSAFASNEMSLVCLHPDMGNHNTYEVYIANNNEVEALKLDSNSNAVVQLSQYAVVTVRSVSGSSHFYVLRANEFGIRELTKDYFFFNDKRNNYELSCSPNGKVGINPAAL